MRVIYKPGNAYEEIACFDFREYQHGLVLLDEEGDNIGYVPPRNPEPRRTASRGRTRVRV